MVGYPVYSMKEAIVLLDNPENVTIKLPLVSLGDSLLAMFGRKYYMQEISRLTHNNRKVTHFPPHMQLHIVQPRPGLRRRGSPDKSPSGCATGG